MEWIFSGSKPVYQQIVRQLRSAILAGAFAPGQRVPSVRELAAQAKVNPNTVQRALGELEQEKILVGSGTAGRFVTQDRDILEALHRQAVSEALESCAVRFRALGLTPGQAAELLAQLEEKEES